MSASRRTKSGAFRPPPGSTWAKRPETGLQRVFRSWGGLGYARPLKRPYGPLWRFLIAFRVERGVKGLRGGPALDALGTTQAYRQTGGRSRRRTSSRLAPTGNAVLPFPAGRGGGDGRVSASLGACSECWPLACLSEKPLLRPLGANCCLSRLRRWGCVRGLSALGERLAACGHIFSRRGSRPKGGGTPQGCPGLQAACSGEFSTAVELGRR